MTGYLLIMKNIINDSNEQPKWCRKPECRPDDILDGALIEFLARGFSGARVEDIAKHAGLSKGTVYLYFSSKEEMLKALVRRSVSPIAGMLKNNADHLKDTDQKAAEVLSGMFKIMAKGLSDAKISSIPLLIIGEAGSFPELASFYRDEVIDVGMSALKTVLIYGVKNGEFKNVNPDHSVRSLMGAFLMQIIWNGTFARADEKIISFDEFAQTHLDIFINGISLPQEN
jgi:AcrR family transcriptional regulator